jgi:hypothetical protein
MTQEREPETPEPEPTEVPEETPGDAETDTTDAEVPVDNG